MLQWHGNVFVDRPSWIHSSIWVLVFDDWLAFGEDWVQEWCLVCDSALALFRTAEGSKRHCTHVRKGHREKWKTAANCLSSPLLVFLTTICYPVWHAGGPMWTIGSDLGQEQVNLVWVLPSSQHNLFSCLFDLLGWKRKRKKRKYLQCLTFDYILT